MAKLPPHSVDAEEAVLGSILIDGLSIEKVADTTRSNDFHTERNRYIYEACLSLYQRELAVDQITIAEEMNNRGRLEESGGAAYLAYLIANCPTSLDIEHYADIVHHHALARQIIEVGTKIIEIGYEGGVNIDDAIGRSRNLLDEVKPARRCSLPYFAFSFWYSDDIKLRSSPWGLYLQQGASHPSQLTWASMTVRSSTAQLPDSGKRGSVRTLPPFLDALTIFLISARN
ncbi:unnamed protein product [marine sediment metagenome]|uniref:DNA helicase DnaB-like N-terminal domain-containing protein n=1 Tax=marine sediment metagenome TaxID=412755 RepID=X1IU08_9ZZZZ